MVYSGPSLIRRGLPSIIPFFTEWYDKLAITKILRRPPFSTLSKDKGPVEVMRKN